MRCVEFWCWGDGRGDAVRSMVPRGRQFEIEWQRSVSRFAGDKVRAGEVAVTTRNVNKQANALAKARGRRRELDKARDEQDRRVEQAAATALVALDVRKAAEASLREATEGLADALNRLVGQDVSVERAAALLELDATEVRRLTKLAVENRRPTSSGARQLAPADSDTRVRATQRADEDRGGEDHHGSHDEADRSEEGRALR
jgi:hypothetical protein